jgi:3'-5' exoribonuclease
VTSPERALPDPRAWLGEAPFPWPAAASLQAGDALHACFALVNITTLKTRQEKPYLRLQLVDRYGPLEGRVWDAAEEIAARLRPGVYVGVRGRLEIFNNERQLKIEAIEQIRVPLDQLELFLPRATRAAEVMDAELAALIASVHDAGLRVLLQRLLGAETELGQGFRLAPAAKHNHHAYLGGLIEHTISVATVCDALARHYGDVVDRDLLLAAALLHDIGKVREIGAQAGFPYTDEGKLLGHILLGLQIVHAAGEQVAELTPERLLLLEHLIASHQGRYEWQSPREPRILEGVLLHYADDLDAKINQVARLLATTPAGWTSYDRSFAREFLRHLRDAPGAAPVASAEAVDVLDGAIEAEPEAPPSVETENGPRRNLAADPLDLFED